MQTVQPGQAGHLGFLDQYITDSEIFSLPSGEKISVPKYFLEFNVWKGAPIPNTYNNKAVIDWEGEPVFAELAVLRLFQLNGWSGVWVDSYRRKFRIGLPDVADPVEVPEAQAQLIDTLRERTGRFGGCWDLLLWKGDETLFAELKRRGKDRIQNTQTDWLSAALESGLARNNFAIVEWDFLSPPTLTFEYPEDRKYFVDLLAGGDEEKFDKEFSDYFDFSHPAIKRWIFNKTSKKVLSELFEKYDGKCQLRIHPECSTTGIWHPDHIIPLASAELHRKLRNLKNNPDGSKPESASYGSNHPKNLTLACEKCNLRKKHRIIWPVQKGQ